MIKLSSSRLRFLIIAPLFLLASLVHATSFIYETAAEITDHADAIVTGTVLSAKPLYDEEKTLWTYYEIAIDDVIKGNTESPVLTLRFYGGEVPGGGSIYLAATPILDMRERYLLFIAEAAIPIINWNYGIFSFRQRPDTGETVLASLDGSVLSGIANGEWQFSGIRLRPDSSHPESAEEIETSIDMDQAPPDTPSAERVLETIRQFVAERRGETSFEPGQTIRSAPLPAGQDARDQ